MQHATVPEDTAWAQAAQKMEVYARRVLKTLCRSAHVRLHSSLLTSLTDDLPLRTWATASSSLRVSPSPAETHVLVYHLLIMNSTAFAQLRSFRLICVITSLRCTRTTVWSCLPAMPFCHQRATWPALGQQHSPPRCRAHAWRNETNL